MQLFLSPDFNIKTLRRKPKSACRKIQEWQQKLTEHQLTGISRILSMYVPQKLFDQHPASSRSRRRIFSMENTFWGFLLQTLQEDGSCQSVVHQFRAKRQLNSKNHTISASTSAFCQARKRLPETLLEDIFDHTKQRGKDLHPLVNRRVICADGTGLTASDTKPNQLCWPQQANQKMGCGFPQIRLCGLFNLYNCLAIDFRSGNKRSHELPMLRDQENSFQSGDIFVGDKGFICFYDQARLLDKGVDSIVVVAKRKPYQASQSDKVLGHDDLLVSVPKFTSQTARNRYPKDRWEALPDVIQMRQIKVAIKVPGFRTSSYFLLTTLLDEVTYPASVIAELYRQRWRVEVNFRDLKTTLGMDVIQSKTPDMVIKEICMFLIAYNLIRQLILDSQDEEEPTEFAFKSCVQALLAHSQLVDSGFAKTQNKLLQGLLNHIADCKLLKRPDRAEPRVVKRRPKPFKIMTKPRAELRAEMVA